MSNFVKHLIYLYLRMWMRWTTNIFHRVIEVRGKENVGRKIPYIFAMNHQNALTDPLTTLSVVPNFIYFLTRADIFSGKLLLEIFDTLKMFPIYRQRDGVDTLKRNQKIFEQCFKVLGRKNSVGIYPEGSHDRHYRVRPLKKGIARLAFQAEESYDFTLGLEILPVGLNYSDHTRFRGRLMISFGKPIPMTNYYDLYQKDPNKALTILKSDVRNAMIQETLHIRLMKHYDLIEDLREIHLTDFSRASSTHSLYDEFLSSKSYIQSIEQWLGDNESQIESLTEQLAQYQTFRTHHSLSDASVAEESISMKKIILQGLLLLLFFPFFVYGGIFNYPMYYLADSLAKKKFKDDHFHSSVKMVIGYLGYPIWYFLLTGIAAFFIPWWATLCFFASLPLLGLFAVNYKEWFQTFRMRMKKRRLKRSQDNNYLKGEALRRELSGFLKKIMLYKPLQETTPSS